MGTGEPLSCCTNLSPEIVVQIERILYVDRSEPGLVGTLHKRLLSRCYHYLTVVELLTNQVFSNGL